MAASIVFYQAFGLKLIVDSAPHYVRFEFPTPNTGEPDTLSLHEVTENWTPPSAWPLIYFELDDLDAYLLDLKEHNITPTNPAKTEDWLWREADILDPSGNTIRLYTAGENRRFPPWRVN